MPTSWSICHGDEVGNRKTYCKGNLPCKNCGRRSVVALMMFAPYVRRRWSMLIPPSAMSAFCWCQLAQLCFCLTAWCVYIRFGTTPERSDGFISANDSLHRMHELFSIMPGEGTPAAYDQEKTTPYYFSTRFDDSLIKVEFSPTERCGYFGSLFRVAKLQ